MSKTLLDSSDLLVTRFAGAGGAVCFQINSKHITEHQKRTDVQLTLQQVKQLLDVLNLELTNVTN